MAAISEQHYELFGAKCRLAERLSPEQMLTELMGGLNVSGRYFALKEKIKVQSKIKIIDPKIISCVTLFVSNSL